MKRLSLALLLVTACATPSQPFEGHPVLAGIRFEGNRTIGSSDLLSKIATTPTTGFFSKTPRYYDADLFELDVKRIVRWYNEKGFYDAKVTDVREERDGEGRVTVVVVIDEGRRAIIRGMRYQGLEDLPRGELSDINDALPIHAGDPFDEDGYETAKDVLQLQLKEHGFARAEVKGSVRVMPEDGSAQIVFDCDKGDRFRFGRVVVTGNRQIPTDQIITATGIHKGDQYSPTAIALAQQRVYNLGTFSGVRVGLEPLGDTPVAAVRVNVREAPFRTFRFGVGGSIEQFRWELPRLTAEYTDRSLFGGLRRLELSSTTGYAFVDSPFSYHPEQSGIATNNTAQLTVPNVLIPGLDWINRAEFTREVQSGFRYYDVAGRSGLLYRRGNHSVAPSLNYVRYFSVALQGADVGDVISRVGASGGLANECPHACFLLYPEIRYSYDGRDNSIEPTQGFYFTSSIQQTVPTGKLATASAPGAFAYFRFNPDLRFYLPTTRYAVLALRAEYGGMFAQGGSGTPFTQRFFFGGQNEQRGYAPLRQGPKLGANPVCNNTGVANPSLRTCAPGETPWATVGVPQGGNSAILFSAELRIHADFILNHLGIVPFVDASRVANAPTDPIFGCGGDRNCSEGLEIAPGLGLRYITPFGPLRLDFAFLANPKDLQTQAIGNAVAATNDGVSCVESSGKTCVHESRWAFHLTLGEAF